MLFDYDMIIDISNLDNHNLVDNKLGLQRGNMFENEYKTYKNYTPKALNINNELLLKLYETNFAIIDLNLYLDLHPNDNKLYDIYKNYVETFEKYKNLYEQNYGPLEITCINSNTYNWIDNPWPWDGGNNNV